jgi:predicted ATPase
MGGGDRQEQLALGETPNIAARLQGLAEPDTMVVSAATYLLVQGFVTCDDLGAQALKGVAAPVQIYRVLGESGALSRLDVAMTRGLTPLVGREAEVTLLLERWAQAKERQGQVVVLSGEAGIGKSRLMQELQARVASEGATRMVFRCSPYHQQSALYPVIEHLQRLLEFHRHDTPTAKLDKLQHVLREDGLPPPEAVPLFAALLSLPPPEHYPPLHLSPRRQKQKTQEALLAWLMAETGRQPVLAVWEDLHWADPSTLEGLNCFLDQVPTTRLLTMLTCRPEFRPPWVSRSYLTQLTVSRFTRSQAEEMVKRVAGGKALQPAVVEQIVTKTDGVPLFVEELTKMLLESGVVREEEDRYVLTNPLPPLAIPTTLQDSLMARLDRLLTAKGMAQLGAVLERQFSFELLQAVSDLDDATLQRELGRLVEAEFIYQRGLPPQATYTFKQALIQEAAYQSLLKRTRQQYHQRIAQVLEAQFPETVEAQPELLAHHYTEAGLGEQAIGYWQRAGERTVQRSANVEAIAHLTKGLEVLRALSDTPEHARQELDLQTALGPALMNTRGPGSPTVEQVYTRARELCQHVGEPQQLFRVLWGLWRYYHNRSELQMAGELGKQLLTLAQQVRDPELLLEAHHALWSTLFFAGELASARGHLEQGMAFYDPQHHRSHVSLHSGHDPGVCCLLHAACVLWFLGYPDQGLKRSEEALALAQKLVQPHNLALALRWVAELHKHRQERQAVQERAEAVMRLSTEQGFELELAQGTILWGWALTGQGQEVEGIAAMRQGLAALRATGGELRRPQVLALLAEAYGGIGQIEEAWNVLAGALAAMEKTGEGLYEAELYRLKGELLLVHSTENHAEAETCFHQALDIARRQQAKSLELRATVSLSRRWQQQGKRDESRELLAPIYGWFTEGFDTADLQEAEALLAEVAR